MERERPPSERGPSLFHPSIRPLHFYTFSITRPGEIFFLFSFFLSSAATVDDTSRCHAHEIREHVCSPGILDIKIHCVSWRSRAYFSIARRKGGAVVVVPRATCPLHITEPSYLAINPAA